MISVVCVYNNERTLREVLLKSLENQTAEFELVTLDNSHSRFRSAAEALNYGGGQARGDYVMFAHQDMWLGSETWLNDVEEVLESIPDLGIAGVAGHSEEGRTWAERRKWSFMGEPEGTGKLVQKPEIVQTLDECLLIVPKPVLDRLSFDEVTFDGWHCYGADYCLSAAELGLKSYVVPGSCSHSCVRANMEGLVDYQRRLFDKHRRDHSRIYTWTGELSWTYFEMRRARRLLGILYGWLLPSPSTLLARELSGCKTLLDLGCGAHSALAFCDILPAMDLTVGVEVFEPALQDSKRKRIHGQYIRADVRALEFRPGSFDAVVALEVLEHLTKAEGVSLLRRMESWARKTVLVAPPNGYLWQDGYDDNPLQAHRSGWTAGELRELEFEVYGLLGWRALRGYQALPKYRPALVWEVFVWVTQRMMHRWPERAFRLLAVKRMQTTD